jgi:DNA-binding MarR family transcriptional regulator
MERDAVGEPEAISAIVYESGIGTGLFGEAAAIAAKATLLEIAFSLRCPMKNDAPEAKAGRLLELSDEVSRIAGSLTQVSIGLRASLQQVFPYSSSNDPHVLLNLVSRLIRARRKRASYIIPELLGEPAWDIPLDLLRAELAFERISVSSACGAAGVSPSTGLRWLNALEEHELILRQGDERDASGAFVVLSPDTSNALRRYVIEVLAAK